MDAHFRIIEHRKSHNTKDSCYLNPNLTNFIKAM